MFYRNTGAPFWRTNAAGEDVVEVPKGHVLEPTPRELKQFGYKLEPVGEQPAATDKVVGPLPQPLPPLPKEWPLKMRPELYLELHPDGVHADLARRLTGSAPVAPAAPAPPSFPERAPSSFPKKDKKRETTTTPPPFGPATGLVRDDDGPHD